MQMPDTTTPRVPGAPVRRRLFYASAFFALMLFLAAPAIRAQDPGPADDQACPGGTEVLNVSDRTNLETEAFTINSEAWQVVVNTTSASEDPVTSFSSVSVVDDNFSTVTTAEFDGDESGVIDVTGAGTYTLSIFTNEQSYDISVVECGGAAPGPEPTPDPGTGPTPEEPPQQQETPKGTVQGQQAGPDIRQTPQTGGVPLLPLAGLMVAAGLGLSFIRRK